MGWGFRKMVKKGFKEEFALFCDSPDRTTFKKLLKENSGEYPHIDFKKEWLEKHILAKHILGFANSKGGVLVVGISEKEDKTFEISGLDEIKDKTIIKQELEKYIPSEIEYEIHDYNYDDSSEWKDIKNKKFQVLIVEDTPQYLPFLSLNSSRNELHKNRVYYRGKTNTEEATNDELKKIINRRLDTNVSTTKEDDFREHINQLKILYSFLQRYYVKAPFWLGNMSQALSAIQGTKEKNPNYPDEDFEDFLVRMVSLKKEIISNKVRK